MKLFGCRLRLLLSGCPRHGALGQEHKSLQPGKSQRVKVMVDPRLLADWKNDGWFMPAGDYGFALGRNAEDLGTPVTVRMPSKTWRD